MNQDQYGDRPSSEYKGVTAPPPLDKPGPHLATAFQPFLKKGYAVDKNLNSTEYQKNLNTGKVLSKERKIDWIWVKGGHPASHSISGFNNAGSDHALIASRIEA